MFESTPAPGDPVWLAADVLDRLLNNYRKPEKYSYDPDAVEKRGRERADEILSVLPKRIDGMQSLELGALDAMASFFLRKERFDTTAIDITDSHFSEKVIDSGVSVHVMSASKLDFNDATFDLVFSYNAFEHLDDPESALTESIRVLRPGGYIYLNFGPLYPSPMGLHAHESIPIPYCQYLFTREMLEEYCRKHDLGTIEFDTMNGWASSEFKNLWKKYSAEIRPVIYSDRLDLYGVELIEKYPECFAGKVETFDDLIVSAIEAVFEKKKIII